MAGSYRLRGNRVQFKLGKYDHTRALVIDPVLTYCTYLGGSGTDYVGNVPLMTSSPSALPRAWSRIRRATYM